MKNNSLRVALRADASVRIGLGHVKRSLALALALQEVGAEVCMVSCALDIGTRSLIASTSIEQFELRPHRFMAGEPQQGGLQETAAELAWDDDAEAMVAAMGNWAPHLIIVDHYSLDARWHQAVRAALNARIAVIDDLADRDLAADWLIDHNQAADHHAKYAGRLQPGTKLLCGPRHALLAPSYATAPRYVFRRSVDSIGIFMGGADSTGRSIDVVLACRKVAQFAGSIEVATTRLNPHISELQATCGRWPRTTVTIDAPDLAGFFARHDLQIGAGGGATWERCCLGAPTLALICADNQQVVIPELVRLGAVATTEPAVDPTVESIGSAAAALLRDPGRRSALAKRALQLVDGLGARRVALCLAASTLALRAATVADGLLTHAWRNDPLTRAMSHDAQEIAFPAHVEWLSRAVADPARQLLIASIGPVPVGVIRFDRGISGEAVVSLYLDPSLHGLGLGSAMLRAGELHACSQPNPPSRLEATVVETNIGSQRMFRSAGYGQNGQRWSKIAPASLSGDTPK